MSDSALDDSIRDLVDALDDFFNASPQNASNVLMRFAIAFGTEPLAGWLGAVLPPVNLDQFKSEALASRKGTIGSGRLPWPADRAERVALQVALIGELARSPSDLRVFAHEFCNSGVNSLSADTQNFGGAILRPMVRDIQRLTEVRSLPPILFDAMGRLPPSGDLVLDGLLTDAIAKFKNAAPQVRKEGLERLWDAWERLKSLEATHDKRISVELLLTRAASGPEMRSLLSTEARALTSIGNDFHIRHFEANRAGIESPRHADYLFHRLFALIHLLLFARNAGAASSERADS